MPTVIRIDGEFAVEESTYPITMDFLDSANDPVTPNSATWSLVDEDGTVINSRSEVTITGLSTSKTIVLEGQDLAISAGFTGNAEKRFFVLEAEYDSDLGTDLSLNDQLEFPVLRLKKNPA